MVKFTDRGKSNAIFEVTTLSNRQYTILSEDPLGSCVYKKCYLRICEWWWQRSRKRSTLSRWLPYGEDMSPDSGTKEEEIDLNDF